MDLYQWILYCASHLIEVMGILLLLALAVRYVAYQSGKKNQLYFNTFSKNVSKHLESEDSRDEIGHVETWLENFLSAILKTLPDRGLRQDVSKGDNKSGFRKGNIESLTEYNEGKKSVVHAIKENVDTLKSSHKPNFDELTNRILSRDRKWNTILQLIPVDTFGRLLDILPGLFIVGGIFGTFIGITAALPRIAEIDLSNLEQATPVLNAFVASVAYSMHTSIAGIVYSVVMQVLNTIFPIASTRQNVKKNLGRSLEFIWFRIHGSEMSHGEKAILNTLSNIHTVLKAQNKKAS